MAVRESLTEVPADLDLKPYRDEHDTELLERMARAIERGHHPSTHQPHKLHTAIHATMSEIKSLPNGFSLPFEERWLSLHLPIDCV